eukprot:1956550-Pyramimonas_sp.AAC.1
MSEYLAVKRRCSRARVMSEVSRGKTSSTEAHGDPLTVGAERLCASVHCLLLPFWASLAPLLAPLPVEG